MKKRIISLGVVILFIVSVFRAEADSVRAFSDNNRLGKETGLSYTSENVSVYPAFPDQKNLRVSTRANSLIVNNRRSFTPAMLMCGVGFDYYLGFPNDVQCADNIHALSEHEHHPGEEIIRYIHDRDGEKECRILL